MNITIYGWSTSEGGHQYQEAEAVTGHPVGQLVHLAHRESRTLFRPLLTSATDLAGIARDDAVVCCGHQHRSQEAVRLSRLRDGYALVQKPGTPVADHRCVDLAQRDIAQVRRDVPFEQATINLDRAGTQARPLRDPDIGVVGQLDLGSVRVDPCALRNLGLD
jgi:hypothetical protein